ncbi:uncharacterized protein PHALS_04359 [Plasmopara halstedii]|uniref:Uncharacterized protein n=1 Tax=Plasmopara halstedii TaxID=4781 RepID=A0A0P1B022_PLAHL|nr:uncharacterized protein PHALS_04359 [Plasmopara halstedii]CEG47488.1 hypothetical protein PHALS_04359 [Plasmopara halstedii]|eukprot:XP_024583857.1 hypothetical protein PHALS_04359 [Plasmopara halstedii]
MNRSLYFRLYFYTRPFNFRLLIHAAYNRHINEKINYQIDGLVKLDRDKRYDIVKYLFCWIYTGDVECLYDDKKVVRELYLQENV